MSDYISHNYSIVKGFAVSLFVILLCDSIFLMLKWKLVHQINYLKIPICREYAE